MGRTWLRLGLLAGALGAAIAAATPAGAAKVYEFAAGGWQGAAYTDTDGRFTHCAVGGVYQSGTSLVFLLRRNFVLAVRLANDDWQLGLDEKYNISLEIDRRPIGNFVATALKTDVLTVRIGTSRDVFDRLRRGKVLVVRAARQNLSFELTGTSRALRELVDCVELARAFAAREANPFAARPPPPAEAQQNPFATRAAPASGRDGDDKHSVLAMLEATGLAKPRLMTPLEQSEFGFDAGVLGWAAEGLIGFVLSEVGEAGPAILLTQLIAGEGAACRGEFASGQQPARTGGVVVTKRGFARCAEGGGALSYFYSVFRKGQRNVVFGFVAPEDAADLAAAASAEIERLMLRLNR